MDGLLSLLIFAGLIRCLACAARVSAISHALFLFYRYVIFAQSYGQQRVGPSEANLM